VKKLVFIITVLLLGKLGFSQDPHFTQFYASPLYLAPSFAGSTKGKRIVTNYRNQWPALQKAFVTYSFSYDHYLPSLNSGLGAMFFRDQAGNGDLSTTNIGLIYSYHIKLNHEWRVIPGFKMLYTQTGLQFNQLTFGDQLISGHPSSSENAGAYSDHTKDLDASASALFYSSQLWMGVTADHLLRPNESLSGKQSLVPMRFSLFGGMKIPINNRYNRKSNENLFPALHFMKQGKNTQMSLGLYWHYNPFMMGLWYRGIPLVKNIPSNDAFALLVGYQIDQFTVGYSYDVTVSNLAGLTQGAHEISLTFNFGQYKSPREKWIPTPCPGLNQNF
jgi:type IX secretion system PorP/SprF family membrane protein